MERQQLAQRYLEGQLSRRVFMRRLVATGVTLGTALAYADLLRADPAAAAASDYYVYVTDYAFAIPTLRTASVGQVVEWGFDSLATHSHSAVDPTGVVNSGFKTPGSVHDQPLPYSGSFGYRCTELTHPANPMNAKVKVPMSVGPTAGPLGTQFQLGWANISPIPAPLVIDVQRKRPSDNSFVIWLRGSTSRATVYTPGAKGTYRFRARVRNSSSGKSSGWSPAATISVT